jgi:hypothetical protein
MHTILLCKLFRRYAMRAGKSSDTAFDAPPKASNPKRDKNETECE